MFENLCSYSMIFILWYLFIWVCGTLYFYLKIQPVCQIHESPFSSKFNSKHIPKQNPITCINILKGSTSWLLMGRGVKSQNKYREKLSKKKIVQAQISEKIYRPNDKKLSSSTKEPKNNSSTLKIYPPPHQKSTGRSQIVNIMFTTRHPKLYCIFYYPNACKTRIYL